MNARHQKVLAAAAALLVTPALSGCGVNFGAQTDQIYTPADGVNHYEGAVEVLNALIISGEPGSGRLIAGVHNNSDEDVTIAGVRGEGESEGISFSIRGGDTTIAPDGLLQLAESEAAYIVASGNPEELRAGFFVRLAISFDNADDVTLNVPVLAPGMYYDDIELPGAGDGGDSPTEGPTGDPADNPAGEPAGEAEEGVGDEPAGEGEDETAGDLEDQAGEDTDETAETTGG